jgi:A/G-specific adenine glycosylase
MHGNDILLEKRPGSGIWGGLWCPPQVESKSKAAEYIHRNDMKVREQIEIDTLAHTFTHFKLYITPMLLRVTSKPLHAQQSGSVWLDVEEALQAAIPTPVRKLLKKITSDD